MKGDMTIDDLARMVAEGFRGVDSRLDGIESRLEGVEGRLKAVEREVRLTNQRIDTVIIPAIDDHSHRIKKLELAIS